MDSFAATNETIPAMQPTQVHQQSKRKRASSKASSKKNTTATTAAPAAAPVFLRKTYDMINTCDPSIASWYDNGTTFVVKDPDQFSSEVIPQYFKHNKFTSFVRQLNFYGFRKIKSDPLRIQDAMDSEESKYWKFRHSKFQRGHPEWLSQIKKSQQTESADKQELEELKKESTMLKSRVSQLTQDVSKLKTLVGVLLQNSGLKEQDFCLPELVPKKRRLLMEQQQKQDAEPIAFPAAPTQPAMMTTAATSGSEPSLMPLPVLSGGDPSSSGLPQSMPSAPGFAMQRSTSTASTNLSSFDDELLASLVDLDPTEMDLSLAEEAAANTVQV